MPNKSTTEKARADARQGKAPSTQAGEFVHEEMDHIRHGKHGAKNPKQAIAIGLSKARRAGVKLPAPRKGTSSPTTRKKAERDLSAGGRKKRAPSARRSRASKNALRKEGRRAASPRALSKQGKQAAAERRRGGPSTPTRKTATRTRGAGRQRARA